jgi:putative heme-binding domain-containing protein
LFAVLLAHEAEPSRPLASKSRSPWSTSRISGSPEAPPPYTPARVFEKIKLNRPLLLTRIPGSNRLAIAEQGGKIVTVVPKPDAAADLFFEASKELRALQTLPGADGFESIYGLAFHPDFARNRECFICYTIKGKRGVNNLADGTRVSRFKVNLPKDGPPQIDPATEEIVITFLQGGHNGGDLHFGPDGYLYISTGDAAGPNPPDPLHTGQDCSDLLASILRIDVNQKDPNKNYAIPKDNPFGDRTHNGKPVRPEIWSFGFRNPWRMSFDRQTGSLWVGDVGWEAWEMIYRVEKGGNYGWSIMEARQPIHTQDRVGPSPILPPTIELDHSQAASITGGYVYRGKKHPDLIGKYIFGDYMTKRIWAATLQDGRVTELKDILPPTVRIVAFGEDHDGELYLLDHDTGTIHSLEKNAKPDYDPATFPRTLSQTGLFQNVKQHQLAAGVYPFEVNAPQWSDGATAERFVALPNQSQILEHDQKKQLGGTIDWLGYQLHFPKDGVLGRTLALELAPGKAQKIETQILHYDGLYWQAYTYAWRDDQSDADLVTADGDERELRVADPRVPGGVRRQRWTFASRAQCLQCHTPWAETTLAFNSLQLNRPVQLGTEEKNQLAWLCELGLMKRVKKDGSPLPAYDAANTAKLPRLANPHDSTAKLEDRARSYLHVHCSHCHRNGGGGAVTFELTRNADLKKGVLDAPPQRGDFGLKDARIVAPGDPERSTLLFRMAKFGKDRMPHIGSELPDPRGVQLIHDWIRGDRKPNETSLPERLQRIHQPDSALVLARRVQQSTNAERAILAAAEKLPSGSLRDLFEGFFPDDGQPRKLGPTPRPRSILSLKGDSTRGATLIRQEKLQCLKCHQLDGQGIAIGPELTKLGKDRTRAELLESLLEPSRRVEAKYQAFAVKTLDGRSYAGLILHRDAKEIRLRDAENKEHRIRVEDLDLVQPMRLSLMPEGLLADLTAQQAADLLEFLSNR